MPRLMAGLVFGKPKRRMPAAGRRASACGPSCDRGCYAEVTQPPITAHLPALCVRRPKVSVVDAGKEFLDRDGQAAARTGARETRDCLGTTALSGKSFARRRSQTA